MLLQLALITLNLIDPNSIQDIPSTPSPNFLAAAIPPYAQTWQLGVYDGCTCEHFLGIGPWIRWATVVYHYTLGEYESHLYCAVAYDDLKFSAQSNLQICRNIYWSDIKGNGNRNRRTISITAFLWNMWTLANTFTNLVIQDTISMLRYDLTLKFKSDSALESNPANDHARTFSILSVGSWDVALVWDKTLVSPIGDMVIYYIASLDRFR